MTIKTVLVGNDKFISMATARKLTGYTASNIYRLYRTGAIKRAKRGATHLYKLSDVERFAIQNDDYEI